MEEAWERALATYGGELLPDDRYEPWTEARRQHVEHLHRQLLRAAGRWTELLAIDPADEPANVALINGSSTVATAPARWPSTTVWPPLWRRSWASARARGPGRRDRAMALSTTGAREPLPTQQVRFCHAADGVRLAYAVAGDGPPLVKAANWLTHLEYDWESALWRHWLRELTNRFRLLRYNERGCGLSDWNTTSFTSRRGWRTSPPWSMPPGMGASRSSACPRAPLSRSSTRRATPTG